MIALDASALMAVMLAEPEAEACRAVLATDEELLLAAPTLTESLIAAARRSLHDGMAALIEALGPTIVPLTRARAYPRSRL